MKWMGLVIVSSSYCDVSPNFYQRGYFEPDVGQTHDAYQDPRLGSHRRDEEDDYQEDPYEGEIVERDRLWLPRRSVEADAIREQPSGDGSRSSDDF